jgi:hypothetical protein
LHLSDEQVRGRILEAVQTQGSNIVVGDPLTALTTEDLNNDMAMINTAREFATLIKEGDPKRLPLIIHHVRASKSGAAAATGFDRGSFARNSKAVYGWTRSQINCVAYNENNNNVLIVSSGKCNNAAEFEPFGIELDTDCMSYSRVEIDLEDWKERIAANGSASHFQKKFSTQQILGVMSAVTPMSFSEVFKASRDDSRCRTPHSNASGLK